MLELIDIKKDYFVAGEAVHALKGINLKFRKNEFVSILGASGCGKTTLLNIIGGLDKYTSGDLIIEGVSTKKYKDREWDTYRNHSIGFIFQSYHLIPHQTVLQNVELALMISGVSKKERRKRAIEALDKVGLKDKMHNRPNQLSGGQAQRVAIARALINNPEIVLADEPTGALDSVTSVQIMDLLKEISQDRLVIMVTHNPELAEKYSTRIINLFDGEVTGDSMPFDGNDAAEAAVQDDGVQAEEYSKGNKKNSSMSVGMAMGLSLKNLLSKRKRTAMVSVAGSIGIIGVSMVLAISAGVQNYINTMENDLLSGNPVSITRQTYDFSTLMSLSGDQVDKGKVLANDKVYINSLLKTLGTFSSGLEKTNNISEAYLDYLTKLPEDSVHVVQQKYEFNIINNLYTDFTVSDNLADHFDSGDVNTGHPFNSAYKNTYNMSVTAIRSMYANVLNQVKGYEGWGGMVSSVATLSEIPDNYQYIASQYDVIAVDKNGAVVTSDFNEAEIESLFNDKQTLVMVLDQQKIADLVLAQYGYLTEDKFLDYALSGVGAESTEELFGKDGLPFETFIGSTSKKFTYYPNNSVYTEISYIPNPIVSDATLFNILDPYIAYDIFIARKSSAMDLAGLYYNPKTYTIATPVGDVQMTLKEYMISFGENMSKYIEGIDLSTPESFVGMFHLPTQLEARKGYAASAYSDGYTYRPNPIDPTQNIEFEAFDKSKGLELGVKLILQRKSDVSYGCLESGFYYTKALTDHILQSEAQSDIVKFIKEGNTVTDVPMYIEYYYVDPKMEKTEEHEAIKTPAGKKYYNFSTATSAIEGITDLMSTMINSVIGGMGSMGISGATSSALSAGLFGGSYKPIAIKFYTKNFETKDTVTDYLDQWNSWCKEGKTYTYTDSDNKQHTVTLAESDKITYTDTVGLIIDMINTMIQMITIALIAFTALSLVVSTVMIGIITYVSVVERVKEIGILRAVGARKKDIKRLFNAETFIIGFVAGLFGILITYLLSLFINIIVMSVAGIWGIAALPWWQALIMIALSVMLTLISGLIPASAAAKKDPVVALRTE